MKNLLNNLLNWVLKKGSSETKKDQAWEEKEQAGSKKDQVKRTKLSEKDQVKGNKLGEKGTSLEMNPCVRGSEAREVRGSEAMSVKGSEAVSANHALITQLSRNNHPISLRAIRYAAVLFMVLMVGIGNVWGADYYLLDHSGSSAAFTGDFICNPTSPTADSRTISGQSFKGYVVTTGNMTSWGSNYAESKTIDYDVKTTSTTFTIYVGNTSSDQPQLYYVVYDESTSAHSNPDVVQTTLGDAIPKGNSTAQYTTRSVTIERSKNARVCFYTSKSSNTKIYQIVASETGSALPKVGEGGYKLNMNKGRFGLNSSKIGKVDGNIEIYAYANYTMANVAQVQLQNGKTSSQYIKFTTPASPGKLKVTWSTGQIAYNTSASATGATNVTSGTEYTLSGNTTYYLVNTGGSTSNITMLEFVASAAKAYTVTAESNNDSWGTVAAGASSLDGGETTTITATPASGYRVASWAVSGSGASISPSGSSHSTTTTLTMGSANATVTCTFEAIPTHSISYTNLKGADNSANPTTYTEGVGVASFTKLRHAVGYDFTGWSPSSITSSATTNQTIDAQWSANAVAAGTGTLTYALAFGSGTITTTSITRNNGALYDATDVSLDHTSFADNANKTGCSGKLTTTSAKSESNYVELTFKIADGYTFTPTEVRVQGIAVSNNKTIEVELTDNAATPNSKSVSGTLTAVDSPTSGGYTVTLDFDASGTVTLEGTVTVKIFAYGATNHWRMGTPFVITGTVASAAPSCTAPNHVDISGAWDKFGGETISLTATAYSSAGTGSPIADGNITGWQWEKLVGSTWTALSNGTAAGVTTSGATTKNLQISNCGQGNSGKYRCVVSTGATCSTASATATDGSEGYVVKVYALECYTGGTTVYNFTRDGNNQRGSVEVDLAARAEGHEFKIHADKYYGNNGTINFDENNWTFTADGNNVTVNSGLGGTFTFTIDYSSNGDVPVLAVTYPRKRIYLSPGVWDADGAKFAYYYFHKTGDDTDAEGWTGFLTNNDCGMYADIPQWNGVKIIAVRFNSSKASTGNWDDKWNQTSDFTVTSNDYIVVSNWDNITYNSTYSTPTYTIGYAKGSVPTGGGSISGSKSNETKTCGVEFTLPSSAVFTTTGYTQTGWTTSDGGAQEYTLGGTYTTNEDKTFYPVWTVNNYDLTWNLGGGTTTSAGTGIASGVSSNTTTSQAFGTALTAPTVTKTGYNFSAWSPAVASTMPAANTTYTATWTVKTTTITIDANTANHGSTAPSPITATYGSALPSFTAATGASGWNLTGYFTAPTSGTKVINANGTLVAGTDYADGSGNWNSEAATLTLYAQYEEEGCTPTTASITFNNNVAGKYNTAWVAGDITTSGGATYTLTNTSCDTGHPMTKPAIKGTKNKTLIQINIPAGATSGTISVSAATYNGGAATIAITNSGGTVLASQSLASTTTNADAGSWSAPTLKTASYNITAGGTYYIKETSDNNNVYIYAFSATGTIPCCTTPAAPTAFANTAVTSTTATFSITDDADAASYDLYYASGSPSTPIAGTAATENVTTKTPTITGLTASTTYKIWVRAVCDASHKSSWVALTGNTFTTSAAEPTALVTWQMKVDQAAWALKSGTTEDGTNITSIASTADEPGSTSTGITGTTGKVVMASGESNVDKAASFTFTVNSAKKVVPEKVTCKVLNVSSGDRTYKAQLSDNNGHVYYSTNTVSVTTENVLTDATFNFASSLVLTGNVTLKVYAWKTSGSPTQFRMGEYVKLFGEVQNAADYTVTHTLSNVTKSAGATSVKEGNNYTATYAGAGGYALPSTITVTIGGSSATAGTDYTWTQGTGVVSIPGNKVTGNTVITVTGVAPAPTYSVTHSLTNVTATSGATGAGAATEGVAYNAVFTANTGYVLPSTITVTIGGETATVGTGYTWNATTGAFQVPAEQVTGAIVITIAGETAPATKDIYYGHVKITDGALVREIPSGATQFFTNIGGTVANNTEISLSSTPSTTGMYYNSNNLTDTELSKSSNWGTSSGSNRYVRGLKFANGATYTLALGAKVASTITFYGWCGSSSKTMTVGDEEFTSSATKETFAKHEFIKTGGFTGNVTITEDGDFYGILVITIQTATPCTTPVIPTLSNQSLCEGADIAAWNATVTNASAISDAGETVTYSWKKKGNATELANTASFDLGASAAESQGGTYVVTVTVSKAGKASATATKEVTLTVNEATEVTAITADKATVYPTNSVTLTATANMDATWNWYLCANADGTGAGSSLGTSSSYTIASAGAAGTYYYKAVATGDCGIGSMVYTLTVSPAASSANCFHYVSVLPDKDISPSSGASIVTPTHATTLEGGTMKVGSQQITITKNGLKLESSKSVSITLDNALEAGNVVIVKGTAATAGYGVTINGVNFYESGSKTFDVSYTVSADDGLEGQTALTVTKYSGSSYLQEIKITGCGEACTDPEVTASVNNSTACVGSSVTFTATGAHASATYQWQKLNGTWTNISGATESTYNINPVAAGDAGKYRVIASNDCNRTSNEVTLSVPSVPNFGSTVPASVSVMQTIALSINTVEATDAVKYKWYKSADATWDAGDVEIGTNKELIKAYDSEAIGSPSYYIFCRAQNACGITTSDPIAVNVTAYVEEDCATRGNESDAEFGFQNSGCGQGTYNSASCWTMNSNSKILIYSAPDGKYFKTMKVTIASSSASQASYNWSTDGGTTYTSNGVAITGVTTTLTEKTIDLSAHGNVNEVKIGRNFGNGESSGTLYVSKICFEYTAACTATTVTPDESSKTYEMGIGSFTEPTFTVKHGGTAFAPQPTLTYSSSNEDIASVDDDGTVTFNGEAGTVTITASYAGATIADVDYCASEGSYTINVSCPGGAPKIVAASTVDLSGCNSSVTLHAKKQDGTAFEDGTYQWFRNGEEIDGATSSSYTATQAGTYTVERTNTSDCTTPSTNSAVVTSETTEPEVERLVPFQYYHVDKTYSDQMKMRHLFAVKNSGTLDGKHFKMYVSCNGGAVTDVTSSNALVVVPNGDGHVDTVMVDLNKLSGKYNENDELVFTCKAIDCTPAVSDVYKNTITMNVIGATPTLALICSGSSKAGGTRKTSELTVGGDFLTGYNVADLCQQTGNTSFNANIEWGLYTNLKTQYIVTPVNGYAVFNRLNYEPFDILLLTDYPKASKSDAAADVLDDMAALCDYRPMLSFKTHMVAKSPSKWAAKGFTTSPVVTKADGRLNLNIVCYAHPMFNSLKTGENVYTDVGNTSAPLVYTMLSGTGYESSKGMQGFELAAAENFVTIGLTHYNATIAKDSPLEGEVEWTPGSEDRMLVTVAERQENPEARFILFSLNIGAHSKLTDKGEQVVLACLNYLLGTAEGTIEPADCSFTFDNGENNEHDDAWYANPSNCAECTGTKGDGKWTTAANWGPDYRLLPGEFTSVRIKKPVEVDDTHAHVMEVRIIDEGRIDIPAGKALDVKSTIRRMDGSEIYPTDVNDIHIGSASTGNGTLIFNNNDGDTKARVDMYSNAPADVENMSAATSTWQYIGTPHTDVANARSNYYGSWLYQYVGGTWTVIPNGGPLVAFRGYCITNETAPVVYDMEGTLVATTTQDIAIPAGYTVIANSWVAPIDINAITDDDMENISDKTIYFFNTGTDADGNHGTGTAAGTYRATPIHSASYTGDWQIPSMQGFYVSTETAGTFHLDYERHVRPAGGRTIVSNPMYAPRRAAMSDEPEVAKLFFRGHRYHDKLVVLEREDFTRGYDSGWDGEAWGGSDLSPMAYVSIDGRYDAVSAVPEYEGTVIGFRAGEDNECTIDFEYSEENEPLYLYDTETKQYTRVVTGNAYHFTTSDKAYHERFILTRNNPQTPTDIGNGEASGNMRAKKFILNDKMYIMINGLLYDATGKVVK